MPEWLRKHLMKLLPQELRLERQKVAAQYKEQVLEYLELYIDQLLC